jgi:hypothetical protein
MTILSRLIIIFTLISVLISCKKSPAGSSILPVDTGLYTDPHDSTFISSFTGYYIYNTLPRYLESYLYDNKKRLALVVAKRYDDYSGASAINDSMFVYYNGADTLISKIICRYRRVINSSPTQRQTIFVVGYNANRQIIYDSLYDYGYNNNNNIVPEHIEFNRYTYLAGGTTVTSISGSISTGLPIIENHTYTLVYDINRNLTQQNLDNRYINKLGYSNVRSPYYKIFNLNYGFIPLLVPYSLMAGPGAGSTRYSQKLITQDTTLETIPVVTSYGRRYTYTNRNDNYPLTYHTDPAYALPPGQFMVNVGEFTYSR